MVAQSMMSKENESAREIVITRVFDAPRELVWDKEFTTTAGRRVAAHHAGPDGSDYPNKSVFLEVVNPQRIVYSHAGGKQGGPG
jgi:uncharacterized protein YndB with AHSA1/START domain